MRRAARLLLALGTVATVVGLSKVHAAWVADPPYDYTGSFRFAWSMAYIGFLGVAAYGFGLPDLAAGARAAVSSALFATLTAAAAISVVQLLTGDALLPRYVVFGSVVVLTPWYVACAGLSSQGRQRGERRDRVVVVARPDEVAALDDDIRRRPERPAVLVAALTPAEATSPDPKRRPLVEAVVAERASVVVLAVAAQADETIVAQAAALHVAGVRVRTLSLFYEEWLGKLPLSELERVSLMFDIGEIHRARYGRVKRMLDLAIGAAAGVALLVAVPVVAAGNLAGNRGPLLYRQERVGRNNRRFEMVKFRTMRPTDPTTTTTWTADDDPRITPFGRLLRTSHVDELPQAINILRGDLSVVGPRPEQPHYVAELTEKIPFYEIRHLVRPGLTGWAQVKYAYGASEVDALEKLQYEFFYLRHQRLALDLRIIGRTIRSVVGRGGR